MQATPVLAYSLAASRKVCQLLVLSLATTTHDDILVVVIVAVVEGVVLSLLDKSQAELASTGFKVSYYYYSVSAVFGGNIFSSQRWL
jgi:hypothetical protein